MPIHQYPKVYLYKRIVQAKLFIDSNYTEEIDLGNISDEACFSKFHFIRLFKQIYGSTPHHYLTTVRVDKSKQLLAAGCAVADACFSVGFTSVSSFTSLFKNAVGITPAAFVSQQLLRQKEIVSNPFKFIPGCIATKNGWLKNSNFQEAGSI